MLIYGFYKFCRLYIGLWPVIIGTILGAGAIAQTLTMEEGENFLYAERLFNDGLYDVAALQFQRYVENYPSGPKAPEAAFRSGVCYQKMEAYDKALQRFQNLVLLYPESAFLDRAQFEIGICYEKLGDYGKAAIAFRRVEIFRPKSDLVPDAFIAAGRNYLAVPNYDAGTEALFAFLEKYPASPQRFQARLLLAQFYLTRGNLDLALLELEKLTGTRIPDDLMAEADFTRAQIFEKRIRFEKAEEIYNRLINSGLKNETIVKAAISLAKIRFARGDYNGTVAALTTIVPFCDNNYSRQVFLMLGDSHFRLKDYREALNSYQRLSSADDGWLLYRKAKVYLESGKTDSAAIMLELTLKGTDTTMADQPGMAVAIGMLYLDILKKANRFQDAVVFGRTLTARLGWIDGVDRLYDKIAGIMHQDLHNPRGAMRLLRIIVEQYPGSIIAPEAQFQLASLYFELGEYPSAQGEFEQYLSLYPGARDHVMAEKLVRFFKKVQLWKPQAPDANLSTPSGVHGQLLSNNSTFNLANFHFFLTHNFGIALWYYQRSLAPETVDVPRDEVLYRISQCYEFLGLDAIWRGEKKLSASYVDSLVNTISSLINQYPQSQYVEPARELALHILFDQNLPGIDLAEIEKYKVKLVTVTDSSTLPIRNALKAIQVPILAGVGSDSATLREAVEVGLQVKFSGISSWMLPGIQFRLAQSYYMLGDYIPAITELKDIIQKYPQYALIAEVYYKLAKIEYQMDQKEAAIATCTGIRDRYFYTIFSDSAGGLLARIYRDSGQPGQALEILEQIKEKKEQFQAPLSEFQEKSDAEIYWHLAQNYNVIGNRQKMISYYVRYIQACPECRNTAAAMYALGNDAWKRGQQEDAVDLFLNLEESFPQDTLSYMGGLRVADILFDKNQYTEARKKFLDVAPRLSRANREHARFRAIICLYRQEKIAAGDQEFENFKREFNNSNFEARLLQEKGDQLLVMKNFAAAEKTFTQITRMQKETQAAGLGELGLGKLYLITNKIDAALETLSKIPEKYNDPEIVALALINLGDFYLQNQQVQNALLVFKKAEQLQVTESMQMITMKLLIRCYKDLGLWDQAIALTRDYIERFPDASDVFSKKVSIGTIMSTMKEYDRAIAYLRDLKRFADRESEPEIQYRIAEAYYNMGRFEEAITEFLKVKYLSLPTKLAWDVTALYQAGVVYMKLERYDRAKQIFEQIAREQGPTSDFGRPAMQKIEQINQLIKQESDRKG